MSVLIHRFLRVAVVAVGILLTWRGSAPIRQALRFRAPAQLLPSNPDSAYAQLVFARVPSI